MKLIAYFLICTFLWSCRGTTSSVESASNHSNTAPDANTSNTTNTNPSWPYPQWEADPTASIQDGKAVAFKSENLTEITITAPSDWEQALKFLNSSVIYKSPTVDSRFANLMLQSSNTKPVPGYPTDPKKNPDYSAFEPEAAFRDYLAKKTEDPTAGRLQMITVDGIWGVLEQVIKDKNGSSNAAATQPVAVWHWTTFMKAKNVNNKVEVIVAYPLADMEHYKSLVAAMINSAKIKREQNVVVIESQPN